MRDKSRIIIFRLRELLMYINSLVLCAQTATIYFHLGACKLSILKQNKGRPGIYKWTHIESG